MGAKASEATKNIKVRQAIDKALDYDAIAQVGTAGFKKPATAYVDENSPYYTKSEKERKVDIEGAKALLAEAGYKDGLQLNLIGLASDNPVYTVVQANLKDIGITVNIKTPDTAQFVGSAFSGDYDIIIVQEEISVIAPSSFAFFKTVNINGPGMCVGGPKWVNKDIDSLVANIISETDKAKAKDMVHQLDVTMHDNMLCSNLYSVMMASVTAKDLKGCQTRERGYIDITSFYK
jgi:peptide/nickel transport system substrate-binding protein